MGPHSLVRGVARSRTGLSNFTFPFHSHALEKEMATHSSVLAWRIPGTAEPGGLPSMGSHRVGHDWSNLAAAAAVNFALLFGDENSEEQMSIIYKCSFQNTSRKYCYDRRYIKNFNLQALGQVMWNQWFAKVSVCQKPTDLLKSDCHSPRLHQFLIHWWESSPSFLGVWSSNKFLIRCCWCWCGPRTTRWGPLCSRRTSWLQAPLKSI